LRLLTFHPEINVFDAIIISRKVRNCGMLDRGQLTALFGRVWVLHAKQLDLVLKKEGVPLTADQYRLMHLLWTRNGAHQEYYARKLGRDRSALSRMLQFLEKEGLLTRKDDVQDQRAKTVQLTPAGQQLQTRAEACANEVLLLMWEGFASEEREQLNEFVSRLRYNLKD